VAVVLVVVEPVVPGKPKQFFILLSNSIIQQINNSLTI